MVVELIESVEELFFDEVDSRFGVEIVGLFFNLFNVEIIGVFVGVGVLL